MAVLWGRRRALGPGVRATAQALMATLVADDAEILGRVNLAQAVNRFDDALAQFPGHVRRGIIASLLLFGYGLPPLDWHFRRFHRMSPAARLNYAASWAGSRVLLKRNLFVLVRLQLLAALLQDPALLDWIGYSEALRRRQGLDASGEAASP